MSELPVGWAADELGSFLTVHYGKALASNSRASEGRIPVIGSSGKVGHHDQALVDGPCLVVGRKGAAGAVHLIQESCWPIDTAYFIQPPSEIDLDFLHYFLSSQSLGQLDKSTAIPSLSRDDLYRVHVPIAPRAEQTRIVEKLESLLADLDAGVNELKAAQRKLAQYRQALLKAAVEGALTEAWRAAAQHNTVRPERSAEGAESKDIAAKSFDSGPAGLRSGRTGDCESGAQLLQRILRERRARFEHKHGGKKKYPEPVALDVSQLPALPEGWVWATGEQLCEFITKGTTPPKELDDGAEKTVPFLRVTNLTDTGELDFTDKVFVSRKVHEGFLARSVVYPNDVLMNIVGPPLGQVSIVSGDFAEWNINQAIAIFRAVDGVASKYIAAYLLSMTAQIWFKKRAKTTAGQTNLTLEMCRELPIPLPTLEEQHQIIAQLDAALTICKEQEHAIAHGLKQAAAQRRNLLRAAFSGQLVPQDPHDEPASVLLARIRAARAEVVQAKGRRGGSIAKHGRKKA